VLTGGTVALGAGGWLGAMPGVGDPGIGSTISGVTLGEGVMLGTRTGVGIAGSSGSPSVGVGGAPHSPEFLEQAVNRAAIMAIWMRRWSFCISRRGLYQQQAAVTFKMTDLLRVLKVLSDNLSDDLIL
jgi:hypothetical protein